MTPISFLAGLPARSLRLVVAFAASWSSFITGFDGGMLFASPPIAASEPLTPEEERERFRLPPGFTIQLVASEPEIQKPMNMAFDHRGRLWVSHSVEYPFAASADVAPRDGITILEAFGTDGRATKAMRFAEGLNIPIGVLPLPRNAGEAGDTAIVWSIPNIWKLADTDGDGRADQREILYGPFDCVDTHGNQNAFRLGADGWIYACHGFRNASKVRLRGAGDVVLDMTSGHTYRFRPDGSAIEMVTRGQVNPFGMCFDALGNRFTVDCHSKPITMLLRGGCYESFGKPHDGLGFAPATTADGHGSTGISGVVVYDAPAFPADYRGSAFVGNVITNAIHRDRLEWRGSSPWVEKAGDFLSCEDWWFRPVDLQLGPDGCLYVADFYNCIIGHYEVDLHHPRRDRTRGRIWRIVWQGEPAADASPPTIASAEAGVDAVIARLADPNITVRRLASEELVARCGGDTTALATLARLATSPAAGGDAAATARSLAVRVIAVCGGLDADTARRVAADPAPIVRVHVAMALADAADWDAARADVVRGLLGDSDPFVRRAAAETLAAHPDVASLEPLLRAWADAGDDPQLAQAARISVRDHLRGLEPAAVAAIALDPPAWLRLAEIAATIPRDSSAWLAFETARTHGASADLLANCLASVAQHCGHDRLDQAVRFARSRVHAADLAAEASTYRPLLEGWIRRGSPLQDADELGRWGAPLAERILASATGTADAPAVSPQAMSLALDVAARLRLAPLAGRAIALLGDARLPTDVRAAALTTALALDRAAAIAAASAVIIDGSQPVAVRDAFVRRLGADGTPAAREALAAALPTAPAAVQQPIALALAAEADGGERLLAIVAAGKASARLLQDKPVLAALASSNLPDLDRRIAQITTGLPSVDQTLGEQIARVATAYASSSPSLENGAAVFRRTCAACHRLAGEGAAIGPALEGVGQRGPHRLLEDILDPNRNVDEAFRTTTATTTDGRTISGLRLRDEGTDVVFADATGREIRVARDAIDETVVSPLSPMPSNMAAQIGEQHLPDLLHYLLMQPPALMQRPAIGQPRP